MKSLLRNLGLILIILAAVILIVLFLTKNVNNNVVLGSTLALAIVGLLCHIILNKRLVD